MSPSSTKSPQRRDPPRVPHPVVLFDGVCNWCGFWVQFLIKRDPQRRFRFAALQSDPGQRLLKAFNLPVDSLNTMVLIDGDRCYTKSSAVLHVTKKMGRLWPLLFVLKVVPPVIRDGVYDLIGRHRYRLLSKRAACLVRTADIEDLFLR